MIIKTTNNLTVNAPKTYLTNLESAGTNILRWRNPSGLSASWALQAGETGEEQTEIILLGTATPAGTAGTLTGNTLYEHPTDTPLYGIKYDQIVFERSTAGTSGTASPMTNGTISIQSDSQYTIFDDTTGSSSYGYRTYFRNSVLNVTSTESDWITPSGFSFYSLASLRQRVKDKLFDSAYIGDDLVIDTWINEWMEIMNATAIDVNEGYSIGTATLSVSSTTNLGTISNSDFKQLKRAWWVNSAGTYPMTKMDATSFSPQTIFSETRPYFSLQGDNIIEVRPEGLSGTASIEYYKLNPSLVNDTDELPVVMRGYTKSFVDYALSQALWKDSKIDLANTKETSANAQLSKFRSEIAPAIKTGPTYVDIVEAVSSDADVWI